MRVLASWLLIKNRKWTITVALSVPLKWAILKTVSTLETVPTLIRRTIMNTTKRYEIYSLYSSYRRHTHLASHRKPAILPAYKYLHLQRTWNKSDRLRCSEVLLHGGLHKTRNPVCSVLIQETGRANPGQFAQLAALTPAWLASSLPSQQQILRL